MNQLACYDHNGDHDRAKQLKKIYDLFADTAREDEAAGEDG